MHRYVRIKLANHMNFAPWEEIEMENRHIARLILKGSWVYGGFGPLPVRIYAINYDFYLELDEEMLEDDREPELNEYGEQYVVVWHNEPFFKGPDMPSKGYMTLHEARDYAQAVVKQIRWHPPVSNHYL